MNFRGWVYVLSNKAMPGLVKIGFSTKDPTLRVHELNGTGLPHSFDIEYDVLTLDPRETEQDVHRRLASHREAKEFFRVEPWLAIQTIRDSINYSCKPFIAESQRDPEPIEGPEKAIVTTSQANSASNLADHKKVVRHYANTCPVCKIEVTGRDSRCPKCFAFLS
jgi:T5orf172 domain